MECIDHIVLTGRACNGRRNCHFKHTRRVAIPQSTSISTHTLEDDDDAENDEGDENENENENEDITPPTLPPASSVSHAKKRYRSNTGSATRHSVPTSISCSSTRMTNSMTSLTIPLCTPSPSTGLRKKRKRTHYRKGYRRPSKKPRTLPLRQQQRENLLRSICHKVTNTGIHVLHDSVINQEEHLVLSLGLSFVPPLLKHKQLIIEAKERFLRKVRIKKFFATEHLDSVSRLEDTPEAKLHLRVNKSLTLKEAEANFTPLTFRSPIENYLKTVSTNLNTLTTAVIPTSRVNFNRWAIFKEVTDKLASRKDIIIKPADKNLGVTVMNRQWYISEAMSPKYLGNPNTYAKLSHPPNIETLAQELKTICYEQKWLSATKITRLSKDFLSDFTRDKVKLCRVYFLPKLHKPTLALRPICASQGWITYWASVYIHLSLFPLLKLIPSYIPNSAQLVSTLDSVNVPQHFQFIPADVDNLYPSINIDEALDAIFEFLSNRTGFPIARTNFLIQLIRWVLRNNYVSFGDNTYLQIQGTAMGTPCAVVVACIFMHIIEEEALSIFKRRYYICTTIFLFKRFIDDYIIIVSDYDTGIILMDILNARRTSINITFAICNTKAEFLDLTLYKTYPDHHLEVRAYSKPMNKYLYLPTSSCHPPHIFSGWIRGYCRRLRLNCSTDSDYANSLEFFKINLLNRGYEESIVTEIFKKIPDRPTIIKSVIDTNTSRTSTVPAIGVPFVITYSPFIHALLPKLKEALTFTEEAQMDPHFPSIFPTSTKPLVVFKRSRNLRELIAPSALS